MMANVYKNIRETIDLSFCLGTLLAMIVASPAWASENTGEAGGSEDPPGETTWVDTGHTAIENRADELATWVDSFFGTTRSVEESPHTIVRIRPQYEWDEQDGTNWKIRAAGRLYLPKASERLSVVFFGSDSEVDDFYNPGVVSDDEAAAGLQYEVPLEEYSTAYLFAGVKAGPQGKVGARYRYERPFLENNRLRFSEELYWIGGDGLGTLTRFDIDHALSRNTLVRWANRAEYSEESNGAEWDSRIAWIRRYDKRTALRVFTFIRGDTDPENLISRGFGIGYRRRFLRDWLHWEIEPRYAWRKRPRDADREGVAMVRVRLEITIGQRQANP